MSEARDPVITWSTNLKDRSYRSLRSGDPSPALLHLTIKLGVAPRIPTPKLEVSSTPGLRIYLDTPASFTFPPP